jgi:esterase/lipase superfamily enzyme
MTKVYFATNREPNRNRAPDDFGNNFSRDGLANLRFGMAEVSGEYLDQCELYLAPERLVYDSERRIKRAADSVLGSKNVFRRVHNKMIHHVRDTLIFVHGYNVSFREALASAAQLKRNFSRSKGGPGINVAVFSWPADGRLESFMAYGDVREDAAVSGSAFARGLLMLTDYVQSLTPEESCYQNLHLLAHSTGNYVLRYALQEFMAQRHGRPPLLFDQVFLVAADEDEDAFEHDHKLGLLPKFTKQVNVYFNINDKAIDVSDKEKANPLRLGECGPIVPHIIPSRIKLIDVSMVTSGLVEHSYYADSTRVTEDMIEVLTGKPADEIHSREYIPGANCYRLR